MNDRYGTVLWIYCVINSAQFFCDESFLTFMFPFLGGFVGKFVIITMRLHVAKGEINEISGTIFNYGFSFGSHDLLKVVIHSQSI